MAHPLKTSQLDLSDAVSAAKNLLGCKLIYDSPEGLTAGIIVETEAYHQDDPASHTHKGKTKRNAVMFEAAGRAYIYLTYGMHYCFNIVTGEAGSGQGVLIRALEPVEGIKLMMKRRGKTKMSTLTNGPGKLAQAMGITMRHYGHDLLVKNQLYIEPGKTPENIATATRIGITLAANEPLRFFIPGNPFVSHTRNV